jgi:short-subunit dehydrogenase
VKLQSNNSDIHFLQVDFEDFSSVRNAAKEFKKYNLPIHYLFNNAGFINLKYEETKDGFERMFRKGFLFLVIRIDVSLPRGKLSWTCSFH